MDGRFCPSANYEVAGWRWNAAKLGLKQESLFQELHQQYNTVPCHIQSERAFYYDVSSIADQADDLEDFHRRLHVRRDQRLQELREIWEAIISHAPPPLSHDDPVGTAFRSLCGNLSFENLLLYVGAHHGSDIYGPVCKKGIDPRVYPPPPPPPAPEKKTAPPPIRVRRVKVRCSPSPPLSPPPPPPPPCRDPFDPHDPSLQATTTRSSNSASSRRRPQAPAREVPDELPGMASPPASTPDMISPHDITSPPTSTPDMVSSHDANLDSPYDIPSPPSTAEEPPKTGHFTNKNSGLPRMPLPRHGDSGSAIGSAWGPGMAAEKHAKEEHCRKRPRSPLISSDDEPSCKFRKMA